MSIDQDEEWREVPGYPGVWASSWGRVHRRSRDGLKNAGRRSEPIYGRLSVRRMKSGITYTNRKVRYAGFPGDLSVARLVCAAFHGEPPSDASVVLHGDDDPLNNRPSNLRWGTQAENLAAPGYRARQSEAWERRKARAAAA